MEFRLPANLQSKLVTYDPELKALARTERSTTTKKSKYPLGNPPVLIPTHIVDDISWQIAVDGINTNLVQRRFREFTRVTAVGNTTHAVLYHYEQCWYAAWLPPEDKKDDYVYGYSYAYKNTATARKALPTQIGQQVELGKTKFITYTKLITKEDIINGLDRHYWNIPSVRSYIKKSQYMYEPIKRLEKQIEISIPQWEDSRNIFQRIKVKCIADVLTYENSRLWDTHDKLTWLPSVELINLIKSTSKEELSKIMLSGHVGNLDKYKDIIHIIDTPYFRKWMQVQCNETIRRFNDPNTKTEKEITQPWNKVFRLFQQIYLVHAVWGDKCSIDYYQSNIDVLISVSFINTYRISAVKDWLSTYMPIASLFTMLNKFYDVKQIGLVNSSSNYSFDRDCGTYRWTFRDLEDTISMLGTVVKTKELAPPKRWRIMEFHDHVQVEAWKITNVNHSLPQDLFPEPVKVQHNDHQWTFIQPIDTHQLAAWGQAVRNCVGNATSYADGVRKKQHFIVLCMIDNQPQFTVQLKVSTGMMTVDQIAGVSNASLTSEQREDYTQVFGQALQQREKVLAST
tara:strand:+ start:453 stop:2159 length:1707 start_codon:yes stop_codon:yes gene_type:complete